jgi:hypothetical protein
LDAGRRPGAGLLALRTCPLQAAVFAPAYSFCEVWVAAEKRRGFLDDLRQASIYEEVLVEVLSQPEADQFDLLANIFQTLTKYVFRI